MEAGEPPRVGQSWARVHAQRVPGRGGRGRECLLARPTGINCCQHWSTSTGPFASLSLRGLPEGTAWRREARGGGVAPASVRSALLGVAGTGVAPGLYQNRERPLREAGVQDGAPGRGRPCGATLSPPFTLTRDCLAGGSLRAGCWAHGWARCGPCPRGSQPPHCWPWPVLLRLAPHPGHCPPPCPESPCGAPRLSHLPLPRDPCPRPGT